ncbi:MAG TPA: DUF87 domain-containing protein, partial [Anaerolineales bacterium]|nr:DUF87 domain-containing protein [Anaerolineales bacterium]
MSLIENELIEKDANKLSDAAKKWFKELVQPSQYVGEVFSISYETALVQIHDHHRKEVGGIPSLSFLIATRITNQEEKIEYSQEDTSIILLRVMDAAQLPGDVEAQRIRAQSAQRVSGEVEQHWDSPETMDAQTNNLLSFAGIECRVIGTFFLENSNNGELALKFGSDLSNYYPNRGLKVFKPNENALKKIVNYQDPERQIDLKSRSRVPIGEIRYASTNRSFQGVSNVEVSISPADLLQQKTALFGMTRTGKSNTTKIIAKSIFDLRFDKQDALRIGQVIFDPNGEYANENTQDSTDKSALNKTALKNVWKSHRDGKAADIVTYGILPHPKDPNRKLMLINFYEEDNLQIGKDNLDSILKDDPAKFISNFRQIRFEKPAETDKSAMTRFNRRVLAYRALLAKADFSIPKSLIPVTSRLFNPELLKKMQNVESDSDNADKFRSAADIFSKANPSWSALANAFEILFDFMKLKEYAEFEYWYINERTQASGDPWADEDLKKILEMHSRPNGARQIGKARNLHTDSTKTDYADDIYKDLKDGKLVIVDQSSGEPEVNDSSARRIMWKIFRENQQVFREGDTPPDILVYLEEAHTLLPSDKETDTNDVWVRTAKEGAKYMIGMVYVTQEVSSIQRNILKNTANWFIGHLNNTDETRELKKFYDFADFESS